MIFIEISMKFHVFTKQKTNVIFKVNFMKTLVGAMYRGGPVEMYVGFATVYATVYHGPVEM